MKDQKNITFKPEYIEMLWLEIIERKSIRKIVMRLIYKGYPKEDIKYTINTWDELTPNQKKEWVKEHITIGDNSNLFVDLVLTLKQNKSPKKALEIWKKNNNLK